MKNLERLQLLSFLSRGIAMGVGLIQGIAVVRILSVSDFGMIGIVMGVGSIFGVSQNLGLASGSTREISRTDDKREISKIFVTSAVIKYTISIPLALLLFFAAEYIAVSRYSNPQLILPLKIFSIVLLVQGVQSLFNSTLSGMQRFKHLFTYQALIAFVSLALYVPLVYKYGFEGYFLALLSFNLIASLTLGIISFSPLRSHFTLPSKSDFKRLLGAILSISLGIYVVKVLFTIWQKSGPLLLGMTVSPLLVGYFSFALFYATKLMLFSDAVTDVNLPVLSKEYLANFDNFKKIFTKNFNVVFAIVILAAFTSLFWLSEIVTVAVGSDKYNPSLILVFPLIFAFIFYSFINIVKSSVLVPAKLIFEMIFGYALMLAATIVFYFIFAETLGDLMAMAIGMAVGAFFGLISFSYFSSKKLKLGFLKWQHFGLLLIAILISLTSNFVFGLESVTSFAQKMLIFTLLTALYFFAIYGAKFVTKTDLDAISAKFSKIKK